MCKIYTAFQFSEHVHLSANTIPLFILVQFMQNKLYILILSKNSHVCVPGSNELLMNFREPNTKFLIFVYFQWSSNDVPMKFICIHTMKL